MVRVFAVVNWGPFVASTEVVRQAVMVGEAVIFCGVSEGFLRILTGPWGADHILRRI